MRFYAGARVGRRMYVGTRLSQKDAATVLPVLAVVMVVWPITAFVLLFNAVWLLMIWIDLARHQWGDALGSLAEQLGWWGFVAAVIWFMRRKPAKRSEEE